MDEDDARSQKEILKDKYHDDMRNMRLAVRWLGEARRFKSDFGNDHWKDDGGGELSGIASDVYLEAVNNVIESRRIAAISKKKWKDYRGED